MTKSGLRCLFGVGGGFLDIVCNLPDCIALAVAVP